MKISRVLLGLATMAALAALTAPGAGAAETKSGKIQISMIGSLSDPKGPTVVVTGAFADAGRFVQGAPESEVELSRGTFKVDDSAGAAREAYVFAHLRKFVDPRTCGISFSYTASVPVSAGTGAYEGIRGTIKVTTTDTGVFPRLADGSCNLSPRAKPVGYVAIARGSGRVTFG